MGLADTAGNHLRVLGSKIENGDGVGHGWVKVRVKVWVKVEKEENFVTKIIG